VLKSLVSELGNEPLLSISREMVDGWLAKTARFPNGEQKAPDTRAATARVFTQFQKWAVDYKHLANPIIAKLPKPAGRERDRIPTAEETEQLLAHASPEFKRIYQALQRTGARPNELCRATIADWDRRRKAIVLKRHKTSEKTGKPRLIPAGKNVEPLLLEAIGDRIEGFIFLPPSAERQRKRGAQTPLRGWTSQRLGVVYRELRKKAGLPADLCLYLARHEFATKVVKEHGLFPAKELLGHTNIKTTQRYAHATDDERLAWQESIQI